MRVGFAAAGEMLWGVWGEVRFRGEMGGISAWIVATMESSWSRDIGVESIDALCLGV